MWKVSDEDIQFKLKLKLGLEQARSVQFYESMADIVSKVFGPGGNKPKAVAPKTADEALAQIRGMFG